MTILKLTNEEKHYVFEVRQTLEAEGFYFSADSALTLVKAMRGGEVISIEEIDSLPPEKAARLYQLLAETGAAGVPPVSGATTLVPKSLKEA